MVQASADEAEIFQIARKITTPDARTAYLRQACGDDATLRERVMALLHIAEDEQSFLEQTAAAYAQTVTSQPLTEVPGTVIGPYRLQEQIGEGGFGVVFMAEQTAPVKRKVALKVIKPGMDTRQVIARFEAERQALALMDHPNIAKVFDAGATETGRPFFVMELVKGVPITEYCDQHQLAPRERLELFVTVCQAVQHAHQKGIIHRDIKPSNVLVTLGDDRPIVKVIDFGIAKATSSQLTEKTLFTGFAQLVGTPLYMSPEQASLSAIDVDTRSDIYSLGVLLYELLTGTTPFDKTRLQQAAFEEVRRIIREEEPQKPSTRLSSLGETLPNVSARRNMEPRRLSQLMRGDLDWIVMKALDKDRARRYETANGFAADVLHHLADEPVQARPPSVGYRLRKFARRNKGALATGVTLTTALVAAVFVLAVSNVLVRNERNAKDEALAEKVQALEDKEVALNEKQTALTQAQANFEEAKRQEGIAREQERIATEQTALANRRLYATQMNLAMQAWEKGESARTVQLLETERPARGADDQRTFEWYYLWRLSHGGHQRTLSAHADGPFTTISQVAFSPDGTLLATAGWGQQKVRLWDVALGSLRTTLEIGRRVWSVAFTRDGSTIATADSGGRVQLWDVATGQVKAVLVGHASQVRCVAFSPDGTRVVSGSDDQTVIIWNVQTAEAQTVLRGHAGIVEGVAFSPDGGCLATVSWDGTARLWSQSADGWQEQRQIQVLNGIVWSVGFSPDGKTLATGGGDLTTRLWDVESGAEQHSFDGVFGDFSPDGTLIVTTRKRSVSVWRVATEALHFRRDHKAVIGATTFSPDGTSVVSADSNGVAEFWDSNPALDRAELQHDGTVNWVAFSSDGEALMAGGSASPLRWNIDDKQAQPFQLTSETTGASALSRDGRTLAMVGVDNSVVMRDLTTGSEVCSIDCDVRPSLIVFSSDGATLAASRPWENDRQVWLLDLTSCRQSSVLKVREAHCAHSFAFSPDGRLLAAGVQFSDVQIWDLSTGELTCVLQQETGLQTIFAVAFSPDGRTLAAGSDAGHIRLWDVETRRLLVTFSGHTTAVHCIQFSPDGRTLVTGGDDATVRFWDILTGQERLTLIGHTQRVTSLAFSPDGDMLASGSRDNTVRLWHAPRTAYALARREFPAGENPSQ